MRLVNFFECVSPAPSKMQLNAFNKFIFFIKLHFACHALDKKNIQAATS